MKKNRYIYIYTQHIKKIKKNNKLMKKWTIQLPNIFIYMHIHNTIIKYIYIYTYIQHIIIKYIYIYNTLKNN